MKFLLLFYKITNRLYVKLGELDSKLVRLLTQKIGKTTQKSGRRIGESLKSINHRINNM